MSDTFTIAEIPVADIVVGDDRHRKDMGDLQGLAKSIGGTGLLQPIGIDKRNKLIFGERRYRAIKDHLGWQNVPCRVIDLDSLAALSAERDENEMRKDFTASEKWSIAQAYREAQEGRRGKSRQQQEELRATNGNAPDVGEKTRDRAAAIVGMSANTLERVGQVVEGGVPELRAAMDAKEIPISAAAEIAELPKPAQRAAVKEIAAGRKPAEVISEQKQKLDRKNGEKKEKSKQEEVKDALGQQVPSSLRDLFADQTLEEQVARLEGWLLAYRNDEVFERVLKVNPHHKYLDAEMIGDSLKAARENVEASLETLRRAIPYALCPRCQGSGVRGQGSGKEEKCAACREGCGYMPRWHYEVVKENMRFQGE